VIDSCDVSAALHVTELNPAKKRKGAFLSFLSLGGEEEKAPPLKPSDDDDQLVYNDLDDEEGVDSLCGTKYSLDTSCIPEEAHSLARFHLSSTITRGEKPNLARSSWERLSLV